MLQVAFVNRFSSAMSSLSFDNLYSLMKPEYILYQFKYIITKFKSQYELIKKETAGRTFFKKLSPNLICTPKI